MNEPTRCSGATRGLGTRGVHGYGKGPADPVLGSPLSLPLIQASTFSFDSPDEMIDVFQGRRAGYSYSRYENPTVVAVEEKIAALENADRAVLFSSGMAAIYATIWGHLKEGDLLLAARGLYGGTSELFRKHVGRIGVRVEVADPEDEQAWSQFLKRRPTAVYLESPTNPLLRVLDGRRLTAEAKSAGAKVIVDNTFATPILQNPMEWGADLVVHSATKYLGGHSDVILGVVVGSADHLLPIEGVRRSQGAVPDPFAAWLVNRGLATLNVRVRSQSETALTVARWLEGRSEFARVHYPGLTSAAGHDIATRQMRGFGGMLALELPGERAGAHAFLRELRVVKLATSLGGPETLASHPATSSHRMLSEIERKELGIHEGLIRISIGLEDAEDLIEDLEGALRASGPGAM